MEIVSWNVNGLRAAIRNGAIDWIKKEGADIVCIQETKLSNEIEIGIKEYTPIWNIGRRKGYSGTLTLAKREPDETIVGLGVEEFDNEGRVIATRFGKLWVINAYFPNAGRGLPRLDFKLRFNKEIESFIEGLKKRSNSIVLCGDFNVAREEIDIANPKQNIHNAGFTKEEREWINSFLAKGYIDTFRYLHPKEVKYTWWTYRFHARERNIGWRLDYFIVPKEFIKNVKESEILDKVMGSDHCPIRLSLNLSP